MIKLLDKHGIEFIKKCDDMFGRIKIVRDPISFKELVGVREEILIGDIKEVDDILLLRILYEDFIQMDNDSIRVSLIFVEVSETKITEIGRKMIYVKLEGLKDHEIKYGKFSVTTKGPMMKYDCDRCCCSYSKQFDKRGRLID